MSFPALSLKPAPDVVYRCPHCHVAMPADGWMVPGMWTLGTYTCPQCARRYVGTLPTAHGILYRMLLELGTETIFTDKPDAWYSKKLRAAYHAKSSTPLKVAVEALRPLRRPVIIDCLEGTYGHALLRLLNAQFYVDAGMDVWLIVPRWLRWMVPDGIAEIWTVELSLRHGDQWNDDLAARIQQRVDALETCALGITFADIPEGQFDLERFTRVTPFDIDGWNTVVDAPVITFVWRSDRSWETLPRAPSMPVRRSLRQRIDRLYYQHEARRINALAAKLRAVYPALDFAVTGVLGSDPMPGFAPDILDLRRPAQAIDAPVERAWCERYARSHVVIGVQGSNMLLPSGHAATAIDLFPKRRFGHLGLDIMPIMPKSFRATLYRFRSMALESSPEQVARMALMLLNQMPQTTLVHNQRVIDRADVAAHYADIWQQFETARAKRDESLL